MNKLEVATQTNFPPIAVFWDLENVQISKSKSVASIIQKLRNNIFSRYIEEDIFILCDVLKEKKSTIDTFVLCNCTVIHVPSEAKNAADHKLQILIGKFSSKNLGGCVVLISSGVNFLPTLNEARYRHKNNIIIIHQSNVNDTFLKVANETINFAQFVSDLENKVQIMPPSGPFQVEVSNLPNKKASILKKELEKLADNTGGKVREISDGHAVLKYATPELAQRSAKRLNDEKVKGKKLVASVKHDDSEPSTSTAAPKRNQNLLERKEKTEKFIEQIKELFQDLDEIPLNSLRRFYSLKFGHNMHVRQMGYNHVQELLDAHPHIFRIAEKQNDKNVFLREKNSTETDSDESHDSSPAKKKRKN